jgi:hypothetical protein
MSPVMCMILYDYRLEYIHCSFIGLRFTEHIKFSCIEGRICPDLSPFNESLLA